MPCGILIDGRSIAELDTNLEIEFRRIFIQLGKVITSVITGQGVDVIKELIEAFSAIKGQPTLEILTWGLIRAALLRSMGSLLREHEQQIQYQLNKNVTKYERLASMPADVLQEKSLLIDRAFFLSPGELRLISEIKPVFAHWLKEVGMLEADANNIAERLPSSFAFALHQQWAINREKYKPIYDAINTPFIDAAENAQGWMHYSAMLQKQINEPIFRESFGLSHVFIPLRGYYEEDNSQLEQERDMPYWTTQAHLDRERYVVDIEKELIRWIEASDRADSLRVICGGPGYGKSSMAKMFAAKVAKDNNAVNVLFIPLHLLDIYNDFESAVEKYVKKWTPINRNPIADMSHSTKRLLIILDGLDELTLLGKSGVDSAAQFIREVVHKLHIHNHQSFKLNVLITGRDIIVQSNQDCFRDMSQIVHILPYYILKPSREKYKDGDDLLVVDQRDEWWVRYGAVKGRSYNGLPPSLRHKSLIEITAQPLLNYLVALSVESGDIVHITDTININSIYEGLLCAVYERDWGENNGRLVDIDKASFFRALENVAVVVWHGDGMGARLSDIQGRFEERKLNKLFSSSPESMGVLQLLGSFYFRARQSRPSEMDVFEFTHKSFSEYLVAREICRTARLITAKLRVEDPDVAFTNDFALLRWASLCAPRALDVNIFKLVCGEIELWKNSIILEMQETFSNLFSHMLRVGMPMHRLEKQGTFKEQTKGARNAEEALLAFLYACARTTGKITKINWPEETSFGEWFSRIRGHRFNLKEAVLLPKCLGFLDLGDQVLLVKDFYGANLKKSNLSNARLELSDLGDSVLSFANLSSANLGDVNLGGANLEAANLSEVRLIDANLRGACLKNANLNNSNLAGADLRGANLANANLRDVKLTEARIEDVDLTGADVHGANLAGLKLNVCNYINIKNLDKAKNVSPRYLEQWNHKNR